jgi:flavin-dependent dehydrogenase
LQKAVEATHFLKSGLALPEWTGTVHKTIANADSSALDRCAGEGWLAVGDSAAAFDPIASQGLSNALASANAAARAACEFIKGNRNALQVYALEMARAYEYYLRGVRRHYLTERRWLDSPFWKARHAGER